MQSEDVKIKIGKRILMARIEAGLTQKQLADSLGVTFQQIQKYEKGINRVSAQMLFAISKVLNVPITYFFKDVDTVPAAAHGEIDYMAKETVVLVKNFYRLPPKIRKFFMGLLSDLVAQESSHTAPRKPGSPPSTPQLPN